MGRGYGDYCPIAKASEVLAERWTPLVIRNLYLDCHTFTEIHEGIPRMSRTLLAERLRRLERAGVVLSKPNAGGRGRRYDLTVAGRELAQVCLELGTWGARWLDLAPEDYDPGVVLWAWKKRLIPQRLPGRRVVVRFDLKDRPKQRFWLLVERDRIELCMKDPGFETELVVATDSVTLTRVHAGRLGLREAQRAGSWSMEGPRDLVKAFPTWGGLSYYATVGPAGKRGRFS
jgi:DNA-binding HxlR family transcriptional regulator